MKNNIEFLQGAIASIRKRGEMKEQEITIEEIAKKAGLSEKQLLAFLSGEEKIPDDFANNLLMSYNFKLVPIQDVNYIPLNFTEDDEDEIEK